VNNPETKATLGTRHIRKTTKNEEYKIQRHRKHRTQDTEQIQKNPNEAIQNEQTRDTGNIREKTQNEEKKPPKNQTQKTKKR
jgi:hypothetical protein